MSGHNPHGHLSQPNSSWNPLQIPSYIPRQPQLAHMSNERPLVRSPLTWHTPTPPEAIYSFISANHKNLELNPLLPSFVRGPPPFGSVDLTIQSARNSTTPSPRNLTSPPPEFVHSKSISCNVTQSSLSNSISPSPGVIQTTGSVREKFSNTSGNNGELPSPGNLFVRDARQINNELVKMTSREPIEEVSEPVELVKDVTCQSIKCPPAPTSPKKLSPAPSVRDNSPASPPIENAAHRVTNENPSVELVNNHIVSTIPPKSVAETITTERTESSPIVLTVPSPSTTTSNEDSIDSNSSKTRRKRKPNKTVRVSNENDNSLPLSEIEQPSLKFPENNDKINTSEKEKNQVSSNDQDSNQTTNPTEESPVIPAELAEKPRNCEPISEKLSENTSKIENGPENKDAIINENKTCPQNDTLTVIVNNTINRSEVEINDVIDTKENCEENANNEEICKEQIDSLNGLDSPRKRSKRKGDSDDIETIDKIAAMIANSNENEDEIGECTLNNIEQSEAQTDKIEAQHNNNSTSSKINDLTEILAAPIKCEVQPSQENLETAKENCFEEVENKLEEMFAGIEDERPLCVETSTLEPPEDQVGNEVTCDLGLDLPLSEKVETQPKQEQTPTSQKRSHSTKLEQVPPKKKRKIVKKALPNQKSMKSKSKHTSKMSGFDKNIKEKSKEEPVVVDMKYKGPYVQIRPDGSINVVNAPITEDDAEKQNKVKKSLHNHSNTERTKIRGLHVSTLSTKYDADTTDASWMCVFCKKGPHKMGLGDLFGPYIVTTSCEEFDLSQKSPCDDEFISKRTKAEMFQKQAKGIPAVPASTGNASTSNSKKKRKMTDSPCATKQQQKNVDSKELLHGMSKVSETSYEVWLHEDCAVWAPGVHIVGARIVGLEPAVWSSTRHKCSICTQNGAVICCLQRGCFEKAHIPCARTQNWVLAEDEFKSFCGSHESSVS